MNGTKYRYSNTSCYFLLRYVNQNTGVNLHFTNTGVGRGSPNLQTLMTRLLAKISTKVSSLMAAYHNDSSFATDGRVCIVLFYVEQSLPF